VDLPQTQIKVSGPQEVVDPSSIKPVAKALQLTAGAVPAGTIEVRSGASMRGPHVFLDKTETHTNSKSVLPDFQIEAIYVPDSVKKPTAELLKHMEATAHNAAK
jgi:hypothetical protein